MTRSTLIAARLLGLPRPYKRGLQACVDFLLVSASVYLAYVLRLESWTPREPAHMAIAAMIAAAVAVATFETMGLYRALIRYVDSAQVMPIAAGLGAGIAALAVTGWILELFVPRTVPLLFALVGTALVGGVRLAAQHLLSVAGSIDAQRVAIYGAGSAGRQLFYALRTARDYAPLFYVDDDPSLQGNRVTGLPIFAPKDLTVLTKRYGITRILLAIPSASATRRRQLIGHMSQLGLPVMTVPSLRDIVNGKLSVSALREVNAGDLLGRVPTPPITELIDADIRGKVVMVTGAGGSIGSELCRLAALHRARVLVLYEISEFALYSIESELAKLAAPDSDLAVYAVLGSVRDYGSLLATLRKYSVQTLYHAAAYKHVPLVEANPFEGLLNNSIGTATTVRAARDAGSVESFVLISTDKAVRPTNIMGASKRLAELICQDAGRHGSKPCFSMVRFGNVLDSSGSVVPLFRSQIKAGGPVTVTHPEITRFFMSIREAAELVIQAGAMRRNGEVFVLDMGTPVRIVDLARSMIVLSGHSVQDETQPDGDIEIRFTGLRPGEKLYEELLIGGGDVTETAHPRIRACRELFLSHSELSAALAELEEAVRMADRVGLENLLKRLPLGYRPSTSTDPSQETDQQHQAQPPDLNGSAPEMMSAPREP